MRRLPATAAAVAAIATVGVGAGTAFAAGSSTTTAPATTPAKTAKPAKAPATLQGVQAAASKAISLRVADLNKEIARVQAAKGLGSDQATLLNTLQGDVTGLQALGQKISGDTTVAAAVTDAKTIYTNYRVLALALPVSRLVVAADRITNVALPRATALESKLAAHVTPADSAQVTPLLADIKAQLASAGSATNGIPAQLLSLTPASYNANHSVLAAPRASVKSAVGDLKKAVADGKQARSDIKAAHKAAHAAKHTRTAAPATAPTGA